MRRTAVASSYHLWALPLLYNAHPNTVKGSFNAWSGGRRMWGHTVIWVRSTSTAVPLRYTRCVMKAEMGHVVSALLRPPYVFAWCPSFSVRAIVLNILMRNERCLHMDTRRYPPNIVHRGVAVSFPIVSRVDCKMVSQRMAR